MQTMNRHTFVETQTQLLTFYKFHGGVSGMRAADSRSISSPYPDRDSHAIRHVTYNFPLAIILKSY